MVSVARGPVKVCQVLHSLHVGGAEVLAARLAHRLAGQFRFTFACLDGLGTLGEALREEGFPVHVLGRRPGVDWSCAARLGAFLRRERVDLVHAHQYTPFLYALLGRWLYRRPPVLFMEHGRHQPDYPRRKRIWANRLLLEKRDRVVGVGETVRRALIENEGLPAGRVSVIYNGVHLAPLLNGAHNRGEVRRELGLGADDLVMFQVARLDPIKDHATAVRTLARVLPHRPDASLVVVGEGPERPSIERTVRELGVGNRVRMLGLRTDVPRLLAGADLFLLTSVSEGIPLTLIEAMARELPVVCTDVGGIPEVVVHGTTGLLASAGDDAALAGHVLRLANESALRAELGRRGRERACSLFAESVMVERYRRLYQDMLGG
jgi:glycosyltransferase involved in cell wall biosynthesis